MPAIDLELTSPGLATRQKLSRPCILCPTKRVPMATKDPRVDAYIAKSADFAKPILKHLRKIVHAGCPEAVEIIKWSMPHFDYKGVMCGMGAFKEHCSFGFWKEALILESDHPRERGGVGS